MMIFLRCIGEALVARGMRGLLGLVPYGEQVYDVAADAIERYRHARRERMPSRLLGKSPLAGPCDHTIGLVGPLLAAEVEGGARF